MVHGTSKKHIQAQERIRKLLIHYYDFVIEEQITPVPNPKYILGDKYARPTIDFHLDVLAEQPIWCDCHGYEFEKICIEIDGQVNHKKTKRQFYKDKHRTDAIEDYIEDIKIVRFDSEELAGKGYINPKTKKLTKTISNDEILERCGISYIK
ncbi:MAG TPA: hypothetical protein VFX18_02610 [Candidatus Nitrosocosmicus sp.]|nr:hypothetical protein [Candidatus Nitrosocosmicus sp.]